MVQVKICGLTRPCDIETVNILKPEYIGFVFAKSRRNITPQQALLLREKLYLDITPVGVFVNEPIENISAIVKNGVIDMIQLHGTEDEGYIQTLKEMTEKPVIKAVSVEKKGDIRAWENSFADYLLLDHKGGGTGESFDWELIGEVHKPFFLAGGLSPENIIKAISKTNPFAVDVSSGVEIEGFKDYKRIQEFIRRVRNGR